VELVQALSVSITGSTGLGDAIAGDRSLISGQNSAIFDLAMLAPGLISPGSGDEIAITAPLATDMIPLAETLPFGFDPVEMPTAEENSLAPMAIETPLKAFSLSGDPLPEASSEKSDAALAQALTALAALEQTGRSSLIPQKARADLLPSILKARLGFEKPRIEEFTIKAEQADPLAPVLTAPSPPDGEAGEPKPSHISLSVFVQTLETFESPSLSEIVYQAGPRPSPEDANILTSDGMLDIVTASLPANEYNDVSTKTVEATLASTMIVAERFAMLKTEPSPVVKSGAPITPTTNLETELAPNNIISAISVHQISAPTVTAHETPSVLVGYKVDASAVTAELTKPSDQTPILEISPVNTATPAPEAITVYSKQNDALPIEEAQRDDRPSFIGELIETPKSIILPNQPMPVAPRAPLSDPAPASKHTAFVFKKETRTEAPEMLLRKTEAQEHGLLRNINQDHTSAATSVNVENSASLLPDVNSSLKTDGAKSQNEFFSVVMPNSVATEEFVNPEAPKTLEFKSLSDVEADLVVNIDRSIDKPVAYDFVKASRIKQDALNHGDLEALRTHIVAEKQISKETKREDGTSEAVASAALHDQALAANASIVNTTVQPIVVSVHPQDTGEATDQESVGTGSSTKKFITTTPPNLSIADQTTPQTSQKVNYDVTADTEQFAAHQTLASEIDIDTTLTTMSAPIKASINDSDIIELKNASLPASKESSTLNDPLPSLTQRASFTGEKTSPDQNNSGYQPRREESFINQNKNDDENLFNSVSDDVFEANKLVGAAPSINDETVKAKLPTGSSVSTAPTQSEPVDTLPSAAGDLYKKAIEPVELSKSVVESIRDVTVMTSHSANIDHNTASGASYAPSSTSYDYRSGYASSQGTAAPENTAAPAYASGENPLFQIQRDRAVEAQVIAALKAGRNEVRLSLYPPQLGQVTINLALDGQKVKVALKTSSREATELLTSEQPSLTHALQREGFSLEGFDVTEDGPHDNRKDDRDQTIITPVPASSGSSEFSIDITI
jgi:flagellar hook-length control protein FliK